MIPLKNIIGHFKTITHHRHLVCLHCFKAGIGFQGLKHDLSKYSPVEFWAGAKYYTGTYSPTEKERKEKGYSVAWMHHKGRNRHHFEYWTDLNPQSHQYEPVEMPVRYVKEMLCDRMAASKTYQGKNYTKNHPYDYFIKANARAKMHPKTADLLEKWLKLLADEGETALFREVRKTK